jgi:RHS repeat-associated protein
LTDGTYTTYGYDDDAQLFSSLGYTSGGGAISAEQLGFVYDGGWNMTQRSVNSSPTTYTVNDFNEITADGVSTYGYDNNGNRTSLATGSAALNYTYDDENRLVSVATDTSTTPSGSRWRSDFLYDGMGRMRVRKEYTWTTGGGGGGESEVPKSGMTISGSGSCWGWNYDYVKDNLNTDPGWHNCDYSSTTEFLRVDLGSSRNVSRVGYLPRVMGPTDDGSWNGVFRQYQIYVTENAGSDPAAWGTPVASGEWSFPNGQERKDVSFTPKMGRYVYFRRVTAWGWFSPPGYACANEIWVYEQAGADTEIAKSGMTLSGSTQGTGWEFDKAKDNLTTDPGWANTTYDSVNEFLRIDLGASHNVCRVGYIPRVLNPVEDGSWNGAYRRYAIYVTDNAGSDPVNWGAAVATGEWYWPNGQERRDVTFTAKTGRYIYLLRISAWGWYASWGYPGYANANEIWAYESGGGGGGGSWTLAGETHYLYDGKRVVQERDASNTPTLSYTRGKDLSGSLEGAGGIGGLLTRSSGYSGGTWSTHNFYHADGNGNITCMQDNNQGIVANYKYDPYGRTISSSGSLAAANLYRFSSKELHANSGMYYYLYRFYDPNTQRWLNRDPVGEKGGINLYSFVANKAPTYIDLWGLDYSTSIERCNRQIENPENDWIIGVANIRGHDFFRWPLHGRGYGGVGFQDPNGRSGDLPQPDHPERARTCRKCEKTGSPLKYGGAAGKTSDNASDADIVDCLQHRPKQGNYDGLRKNCNDWADGAESDCGLSCTGNNYTPK